jgi:hypothetical protein
MPTPSPSGVTRLQIVLESDNTEAMNAAVRDTGGWGKGDFVNAELDLLRELNLPELPLRAVRAEAARRGITTRDILQSIASDHAATLPPTRVKTQPQPMGEVLRTNIAFSPANQAYIAQRALLGNGEFSATLNAELRFARNYGLQPEALARLEEAAAEKQVSVRDYVLNLVFAYAFALPPAPPPPKKRRAPL